MSGRTPALVVGAGRLLPRGLLDVKTPIGAKWNRLLIVGPASLIIVKPGTGQGIHQLAACVHVELRVGAREVGLHGSFSDVQLLSDRLCREALGRKSGDLALPVGECGGAKESGGRSLARLTELVEVRQDLVVAPSAAARCEEVRRVAQPGELPPGGRRC